MRNFAIMNSLKKVRTVFTGSEKIVQAVGEGLIVAENEALLSF